MQCCWTCPPSADKLNFSRISGEIVKFMLLARQLDLEDNKTKYISPVLLWLEHEQSFQSCYLTFNCLSETPAPFPADWLAVTRPDTEVRGLYHTSHETLRQILHFPRRRNKILNLSPWLSPPLNCDVLRFNFDKAPRWVCVRPTTNKGESHP